MIRIGMMKTGLHGYLFGGCLSPYDRYEFLRGGGQLNILESDFDPVIPFPDTKVVKVWDPEPERAEQFARAFSCEVASDPEDASEDVDAVFLAETSGTGEDHPELAAVPIRKGVPTFVDKPLADSVEHARAILEMAEARGVPVMSSSLLRYAKANERLRELNLGEVRLASVTAGGKVGKVVSGIHACSALMGFWGPGVEAVRTLPLGSAGEVVFLRYKDGRAGLLKFLRGVKAEFQVTVYTSKGIFSEGTPMPEYRYGAVRVARRFVEMVKTGEPPIPYGEMLEEIAVLEAAKMSLDEGREVEISELTGG